MCIGWMFSVSVGYFRDARGKSYESMGIAPDIATVNRREDILDGKDVVLKHAIVKLD